MSRREEKVREEKRNGKRKVKKKRWGKGGVGGGKRGRGGKLVEGGEKGERRGGGGHRTSQGARQPQLQDMPHDCSFMVEKQNVSLFFSLPSNLICLLFLSLLWHTESVSLSVCLRLSSGHVAVHR